MKTPNVSFVKSAVHLADMPEDGRPEVAILGRSNAGKSSLINALYAARVAKTSAQPGKTRTINLFNVGKHYRVVDFPGYGYAKRSGAEQRSWSRMVETYLALRATLVGFVLVMDVRRDWQNEEKDILRWLGPRRLKLLVALSKADKLGRSQAERRRQQIATQSGLPLQQVRLASALSGEGTAAIEETIFSDWVQTPLIVQ